MKPHQVNASTRSAIAPAAIVFLGFWVCIAAASLIAAVLH